MIPATAIDADLGWTRQDVPHARQTYARHLYSLISHIKMRTLKPSPPSLRWNVVPLNLLDAASQIFTSVFSRRVVPDPPSWYVSMKHQVC